MGERRKNSKTSKDYGAVKIVTTETIFKNLSNCSSLKVNTFQATLKSLSTGAERDGMLKNYPTFGTCDKSVPNFINHLGVYKLS